MSSTRSSSGSSTPEAGLPAGLNGGRRDLDDVYQGEEYRAVAGLPLDPLVHQRPERPTRAYRVVYGLLWVVVRLLFRVHVEGRENIPATPFIIAANHTRWYDSVFIIGAFIQSRRLPMVYTMARRDTVFNRRWKRWLFPRFGVFPVLPRQGQLDHRAIATVYQLLARGAVVLIFPEGGYSRGRRLRPLKKGVAHFALEAGVPICPVAVSGLDRLRPLGRVSLSIGPPIRPDPPGWWDLNRRVLRTVESVRLAIIHAFEREDGGHRRRWRARAWVRFRGIRRRLGRRRSPVKPEEEDRGGP
jgi:1-acyl-sn-glycerol-3-phosphate acyltransferase